MSTPATGSLRRRVVSPATIARALPWALLTIGLVVAFVVPLGVLVVMSFRTALPGLPGMWTLNGYVTAYTNGAIIKPLFDSLAFAIASAVCATAIALFFVFVATRTTVRLRNMVTPVMVIILATPALFFALSWGMLGANRVGLINKSLSALFGGEHDFSISSWPGLIMVMSLKLSSFCYFLILGPSKNMNRSLEEAAEVSGAGRMGAFFRVYFPLMTPSIMGSLLVGFIATLQAFDTPQIIGLPAGIHVFSTEIYRLVNFMPANYPGAASLAIGLVLILGALVWLQLSYLKRKDYTTVGGKSTHPAPWRFPRTGWIMSLAVVVFALVALALPTVQLLLSSLNTVFGRYDGFSLRNYQQLFDNPVTTTAINNTVVFMVVGGLVTVLLGTVITYALRIRPNRWKRLLELPTWTPWAMPGLVAALALLGTVLAFAPLHWLYGSAALMFVALVIASLPIAMRFTESAVLQIDRQLIDAARIGGAGASRSFLSILVPLIAPSFISGWFVTGLAVAGNLEVPLLLGTLKQTTIAGLAYKYYVDAYAPLAAAIFCILLLAVVAMFLVGLVLRQVISALVRRRNSGLGLLAAAPGALEALEIEPETAVGASR